MEDSKKEEKARHGLRKHTLNLKIQEQGLEKFLWKHYKNKQFKIRSYIWPNSQNIPYEHFYIEGPKDEEDDGDDDDQEDLEFGGGSGRCIRFEFRPYPTNPKKESNPYMDKDTFLYSFVPPNDAHVTVTDFEMTKEVWKRMNFVCSATNFSFCLRNSEHLVNYIVFAKWNCNQMQIGNSLRGYFDDTLDGENRQLIALLPRELKEAEEVKMNGARKQLFLGQIKEAIKFDRKITVEEFKSQDNSMDYNIIFAGPTGAGKSTLINLAFNETICKTDVDTSSSVTREVTILSGEYMCKDKDEIRVNIFDTMGVCDTYLDNDEVIEDLMQAIDIAKSKIVIVCSGTIKADHKEAIKQLLNKLDYENNRDNFIFLYNKSEGMKRRDKDAGLREMGKALGVDLDYEITFSVPDPATGDRIAKKYYTGCCTGFNTESHDQDCIDTFRVLTDRVLPQAYDDHRKRKIIIQ